MGSVGVCPVDAVTSTQNMGMNFCAGTIVAQLGTTIVYDVRQDASGGIGLNQAEKAVNDGLGSIWSNTAWSPPVLNQYEATLW